MVFISLKCSAASPRYSFVSLTIRVVSSIFLLNHIFRWSLLSVPFSFETMPLPELENFSSLETVHEVIEAVPTRWHHLWSDLQWILIVFTPLKFMPHLHTLSKSNFFFFLFITKPSKPPNYK